MPNFFYYDANGQKQGPVDDQQLKALATQGVINTQTALETDTGHQGQAGQIPGLNFNAAVPSPFAPPHSPATTPLVIHRASALYGCARSYGIFVNGQNLGKIANGKTAQFFVPTGFIKLEVKAFEMRIIVPVTLDLSSGREKKVAIRVKTHYLWTVILLTLVAIIPGIIYSLVVPPCVIEEQN